MTISPINLAVEPWPLDRLMPYARNARTHSDEQVTQIAASIAEFGFNNPVLVDGRGEIIAGHGRALGAERLGLTEVPVIVLAHLTEAQKRAFGLADNRIALDAGWDEELLRLELGELRLEDFDLDGRALSAKTAAPRLKSNPKPAQRDNLETFVINPG